MQPNVDSIRYTVGSASGNRHVCHIINQLLPASTTSRLLSPLKNRLFKTLGKNARFSSAPRDGPRQETLLGYKSGDVGFYAFLFLSTASVPMATVASAMWSPRVRGTESVM